MMYGAAPEVPDTMLLNGVVLINDQKQSHAPQALQHNTKISKSATGTGSYRKELSIWQ
jgi:hypothetical protein